MSSDPRAFTRRAFLGRSLIMASAAASIPAFLAGTAKAMHGTLEAAGLSSLPGVPDDHVLVVVQLSGGNDGLNMIVPFGQGEYYRARPGIGIREQDCLKLSGADGVGLHPAMGPIKELYDDGLCGIVQGVGYPNPNRSHFKSMDIWHTADTSATGDGWLGRYFDSECVGFGKGESGTAEAAGNGATGGADGPPGVAIGRTAPLAMQGRLIKPVAFESADLFRWSGRDIHDALRDPYAALNAGHASDQASGSNAEFLTRTALDAQVSSDLIRRAVARRPEVTYPQTDLGRQLSMVASMIGAGLRTRVYYVQQGGYDTHAGQGGTQGRHAQLLGQLSAAVRAFFADLKQQGNDSRVLAMSFSEFGRRVGQNASQGTDHGTAAPMMVFGPMVRPGVLNAHPSLRDLDEGDLKFSTDFREVYAGVLEGWMKSDSKTILEGTYRPFRLFKA
jgi:uncharacterized protein (DUF1501 family)